MKNYLFLLVIGFAVFGQPSYAQMDKNLGQKVYESIVAEAPQSIRQNYPYELGEVAASLCAILANQLAIEKDLGLDQSHKNYIEKVARQVIGADFDGFEIVFCLRSHIDFVGFVGKYMMVELSSMHLLATEGVLAAAISRAYGLRQNQTVVKLMVGVKVGKISTQNFRDEKNFTRLANAAADSIAMDLMVTSGYGLSSLLEFMRTHEHFSHKYAILSSPREQPYVEFWLKKNRRALETLSTQDQQQFIISQEEFYSFQDTPIKKILAYHFCKGNYTEQLILAFKYHLFYPNDPSFILHILQANRHARLLLLGQFYPAEVDELNFLSSLQLVADQSKPVTQEQPYPYPIFEKFTPAVFNTRPQQASRIKTTDYWSEKPFATEAEAFEFFIEKLKALNNPEAYLEQALRTRDEDLRHVYLQEYLSQENIKYRSYAESFTSGDVYSSIDDRTAVVGGEIGLAIIAKNSKVPILDRDSAYWQSYWSDSAFQSLGDTLFILNRSELQQRLVGYKFDNYFYYLSQYHGRHSKFYEEHEFLEYHLPEYWILFKEYNCREFILLNGSISCLSKARKDVETLERQYFMPLADFLVEPKMARTLYYTKWRLDLERNYKLRSVNNGSMNGSKKIHPLEQMKNIFVGMPLN